MAEGGAEVLDEVCPAEMRPAEISGLFFDLDGTLTDPKPGITRSIQHALGALGRPVPAAETLTWCIGPPLLDSFAQLLGDQQAAVRALAHYRERFAEKGLFENRVYGGIPEALEALRSAGLRLFVATSKPLIYAERILAHFELAPFFEHVFGPGLDGALSDKTALLGHALEITGADPTQSAMVGDRKHDIIGARNRGLTAIGVLYGYGQRTELEAAGAHRLIETPAALHGIARTQGRGQNKNQ